MSELLKINVNEHTEKKNNLTYLSWAWAWAEVLKIDPKATWRVHLYKYQDREVPCMFMPDGTAMVTVDVQIKGDEKGAVLPVMNHRNQAIKNPDAFAINTGIQRCLAKAIAMHGLGLYIYAGEDLPEGEEPPETQEEEPAPKAPQRKENGRLEGVGVHKPAGDIFDKLDEDQQRYILLLASVLPKMFEQQGVEAVCNRLERDNLDSDQTVALWDKLGPYSKLRSAVKKEQERRATAQKETA